jgi:hypothetical protein
VAYLNIAQPAADGTAAAALYDYDEFSSCIPTRPLNGELTKDILSNRVFMDGILQLDQAELTLSGSTLTIEFNDDFDINQNGSTQDRVTIQGSRVGVSQISDLGPSC